MISSRNLVEKQRKCNIYLVFIPYGGGTLIFNYRLNALYYMISEKNYPAFRPEIGVGLYRVQVSFGRNIFFEKMDLETISKWNISAYYYFPVLPRRKI